MPGEPTEPEVAYTCKRATKLHTEQCMQTDTSKYCSGTEEYTTGSTITYGNEEVTDGTLTSGDPFDCDVNGDEIYDPDTERFYYVSDLDSETAVLIYYNNVKEGNPDNTTAYAYDLTNENEKFVNNNGPVTAASYLPTTTQWKKVSLKNPIRQITNETGTTTTSAGDIVTFDYSVYAARLLTAQEVNDACGIIVGSSDTDELKNCKYLMENTKYSNSSLPYGYWLETPRLTISSRIWVISSLDRNVGDVDANHTTFSGVRPVIEVPKTEIQY